ncbi:hypothetical protein [Leisingera sp. MMG026]|uniref:hypothetical protein n=1 Tax=Leisingera sp. MMG026 TaxID=2909982 RepID=UPI001F25B90D|nr:hypothetical protein [Leisingera sp. MMG026]MCF6429476.1 hypothetical protein [Leisingera sp. MMG026]
MQRFFLLAARLLRRVTLAAIPGGFLQLCDGLKNILVTNHPDDANTHHIKIDPRY